MGRSVKGVILACLVILGIGVALAAANLQPNAFLSGAGFTLAGVALGVGIVLLAVQEILDRRQGSQEQDVKRKLLRAIGRDYVGAVASVFSAPTFRSPSPLTFGGSEIAQAWSHLIETGRASPGGLKEALLRQYRNAASAEGEMGGAKPLRPRPVLIDLSNAFDTGLLLVTRALGRAYARPDLFDEEELPTGELESAAAMLREGRAKGTLDDAQAASLVGSLSEAVEACGRLLWGLGGFVKREAPVAPPEGHAAPAG